MIHKNVKNEYHQKKRKATTAIKPQKEDPINKTQIHNGKDVSSVMPVVIKDSL